MSLSQGLTTRSKICCELCTAESSTLTSYLVPPKSEDLDNNCVVICETCLPMIEADSFYDNSAHWRCLGQSIWSSTPSVVVLSYYILERLESETWAQDILGVAFLDESSDAWLDKLKEIKGGSSQVHQDSNGNILTNGDTVTLVKDLDVKGVNFIAKRGTAVKNIRLVSENISQIEGKIENQQIVILAQYVKKA